MTILFAITSILLAIIAAAYLQLPTFLLVLGYRWFHNYRAKRWAFRSLALLALLAFWSTQPPLWGLVATTIPVVFFLGFSLVNANPKVYIALDQTTVVKKARNDYPAGTSVVGYADEAGWSIAYPMREMVQPRHLINDTVHGKPLFVSYCMACRSAMVYEPVVDGLRLHFDVLGVYRRNMVMGDRETGTVWQQGTGEAIYGTLKGTRLKFLPYQIVTIGEWLSEHPDSLVASESESVKDGIFSKDRLMKMMEITERMVAPGKVDLTGLPLRETVFGVETRDGATAYPVSELRKARGPFQDVIGSVEVTVDYDAGRHRMYVKDAASGVHYVAQSHWWYGWKEFHPDTNIWTFKAE